MCHQIEYFSCVIHYRSTSSPDVIRAWMGASDQSLQPRSSLLFSFSSLHQTFFLNFALFISFNISFSFLQNVHSFPHTFTPVGLTELTNKKRTVSVKRHKPGHTTDSWAAWEVQYESNFPTSLRIRVLVWNLELYYGAGSSLWWKVLNDAKHTESGLFLTLQCPLTETVSNLDQKEMNLSFISPTGSALNLSNN